MQKWGWLLGEHTLMDVCVCVCALIHTYTFSLHASLHACVICALPCNICASVCVCVCLCACILYVHAWVHASVFLCVSESYSWVSMYSVICVYVWYTVCVCVCVRQLSSILSPLQSPVASDELQQRSGTRTNIPVATLKNIIPTLLPGQQYDNNNILPHCFLLQQYMEKI